MCHVSTIDTFTFSLNKSYLNVIVSSIYLGQIVDEPSDQCEAIGSRVEFACSSSSGLVHWHRLRGSSEYISISFGDIILYEPEHYSITSDETDPDRKIFNLVINGMTAEMVGDLYHCETVGTLSRQASLSKKGTLIAKTHKQSCYLL